MKKIFSIFALALLAGLAGAFPSILMTTNGDILFTNLTATNLNVIGGSFEGDASKATNLNLTAPQISAGGGLTNNLALYGQPWAALRHAPAGWYSAPYNVGGIYEGEAYITNTLGLMLANGDWQRFTNANPEAWWFFDVGWDGGRYTITNWDANILRNLGGHLKYDTTLFPRGMDWTTAFLHSNGCKVCLAFVGTTLRLTNGADAIICSAQGTGFRYWTNATSGILPTNTSGKYITALSIDKAMEDISTMFAWGVDGFAPADVGNSYEDYIALDQVFGNAALRVRVPADYNQPGNTLTNFSNVNTNLFTFSKPGQFVPDRPAAFFAGKTMMYMAYQNAGTEQRVMGSSTIGSHAAFAYDNTGQMNTGIGAPGALLLELQDFPTTKKANEGAYIFWQGYAQPGAEAVSHGFALCGYTNESLFGSSGSGYLGMVTNLAWAAIHNDPAQNWYQRIPLNNGVNRGEAFWCYLADGSVALALYNLTNTGVTFPLTWPQFGWPSNLNVQIVNVMNQTVVGTATNGLNFGVASGQFPFLRLTPLVPLQLQSQIDAMGYYPNGTATTVISNSFPGPGALVLSRGLAYDRTQLPVWANGGYVGLNNFSGTGPRILSGQMYHADNNATFGSYVGYEYDGSHNGIMGTVVSGVVGTNLTWNSTGSFLWKPTVFSNGLNCVSGSITNGSTVWYFLSINSAPSFAAPPGSLCTTTNGQFYVSSNNVGSTVWLLK